MPITFPNESPEYRSARTALLEAEKTLRAQVEKVARLRRSLPRGGKLKENYRFTEANGDGVREVLFSDLFKRGDDTLFIYNFMYSPDMDGPCPMCTAFLDGLAMQFQHLERRISTAVVAKHDPEILQSYADRRGWTDMRLLSSSGTGFNRDYGGEVDGRQMTAANVFIRNGEDIYHFWNSEMAYEPFIEGGELRHVDLMWPLWNVLDLTPGGRGDWHPQVDYD